MKTMKKITVTFMSLIMVVAMIGMFAVNVSAAKETVNGFTVQVIDLVAVDRDGTTANYGTRESTFVKVNMTVVNSTTVKFTYNVWFAAASGSGDSQARDQVVTVNDYSCTKDLDVSIDKSFSQGGDNWTYKMKITKSAGHLYDNACDADCNVCGQTRTITHDYQNDTCTTDATCSVCGDVKVATGHNDVGGTCTGCGEKVVAKVVTTDNVTTIYTDIYEAAAYAVTQNNSTLTLLADVDLADGKGLFEGLKGKLAVTLDLNGKTLSSANSSTINWDSFGYVYTHYTLTINDSVGTGKVINTEWHAVTTNAGLTINGGYFEGCWELNHQAFAINCNGMSISYNDTVTINGGTFYANNGISGDQLTYFVINGGSFRGDNSVIHSSYEGLFVINDAEFPEGLVVAQWSEPISTLLAPGVFLRDENGNIITLTSTATSARGARSASAGADLAADGATVTVNTTPYSYTGLQHKPTVTVVVGGYTLTEGVDYELSWSNNVNIGTEAVVTVTGKGDFSGTVSANFAIVKGTLEVSVAATVTYAFGDTYVGKAVTGGEVVAVGNSSLVVSGTWTWVEGTDKATFTPDAQYADLFETFTEQVTVTKNIVAGDPVLTLTTPSPSIMPGMSIRMSVGSENAFDSSITDLPTQFNITYKVNGATPVTVSGLEFTLPTSVTLGDTVEVYVENVAVEGKYSVGKSNVIELAVGQVDYTDHIDKVQQNLDDAINALNEAIAKKVDATEIAEKIENLDAAYQAADTAINSEIAKLQADDEAIRNSITDLEGKMNEADKALEDAIDAVETALNTAKTELQAAIDANESDIEEKVAKLEEAYKAADELINTDIAGLKAEDGTIKQSIADLESAMNKADKTLTNSINQLSSKLTSTKSALEKAIANLETAMENGDAELSVQIEALNKALTDAKAALEKADADNKSELTSAINAAYESLDAAVKTVQKNLDDAGARKTFLAAFASRRISLMRSPLPRILI